MKNALKITVLSLGLASAALAADKTPAVVTKTVTGEAAIVGKDEARAKQQARDEALREAVQQVAGVLLEADTVVLNSTLLSDRISANTTGYVRKYEVVKEEKTGNVMAVTVRAEVGTAELDKDVQAVKALVKRLGSKRLVIVIQEQTVDGKGQVIASGNVGAVLTDAFKKDGWTILDPTFAAGQLNLASGVALGTPEAKKIADLSKADYVLYGTASFRNEDPGVMMKAADNEKQSYFPVSGAVDLAMFATDSGSQLSQVTTRLTYKKGDDPRPRVINYEKSAADLAQIRSDEYLVPLRNKVLESLRSNEQNGNRVAVTVEGLRDFSSVKAFRGAIAKAIKGVKDVSSGNFGKGKAEFDVMFVGTTEAFAEELASARFKGKKVVVTGVTGNTITASVSP